MFSFAALTYKSAILLVITELSSRFAEAMKSQTGFVFALLKRTLFAAFGCTSLATLIVFEGILESIIESSTIFWLVIELSAIFAVVTAES